MSTTPTRPLPLPDQSAFDNAEDFFLKEELSPLVRDPPPLKSPCPSARVNRSLYSPTPRAVHAEPANIVSFSEFSSIQPIGQGSFGEVFKAKSPIDGKFYAIKKLHPYKGIKDRERRLREILTVKSLGNHPHIIQYIDGWEESGCLHIQTELCPLGNLANLLQQSPLEEFTIWNFLLDITLGIKHLHDSHILHLDIKPGNIFITKTENGTFELKLGDFGMAINEQQVKSQWTSGDEGDAAYVAPEILSYTRTSKRSVARPADCFSLGCTLFEMCAHLSLPPSGPMWQMLRSGEVELSPHLGKHWYGRSEGLRSLTQSLLYPEPIARPTVDDVLEMEKIKELLVERYDDPCPFPRREGLRHQSHHHRHVASRGSSVTDLFTCSVGSSFSLYDPAQDDEWLMSSEPTRMSKKSVDVFGKKEKRLSELRRPSFLSINSDCLPFNSEDFCVEIRNIDTPPPLLFDSEEDSVLH
ncbi:hypothetical protein P9112_009691 [Eukaryota sp. TZLM1-RC]